MQTETQGNEKSTPITQEELLERREKAKKYLLGRIHDLRSERNLWEQKLRSWFASGSKSIAKTQLNIVNAALKAYSEAYDLIAFGVILKITKESFEQVN